MRRGPNALMIYSLGRGGAERATVRLAGGLCDAGHAVDLVVARAQGPQVADRARRKPV